jgi:hypothetical protein
MLQQYSLKSIQTIALVVMTCMAEPCFAQRQLVLLSKGVPAHHFKEGDTFRSRWAGDNMEYWGFLVEIHEDYLITSQDTIPIRKIRKVLLPGKNKIYRAGQLLVLIGTAFFVIDQFNTTIVQQNDPSLDPDVWKPAAVITLAGVPMLFFKKKWRKIGRGLKLISVDNTSRFYLRD